MFSEIVLKLGEFNIKTRKKNLPVVSEKYDKKRENKFIFLAMASIGKYFFLF